MTVVRLKTPKTLDEDTIRAVFEPIYSLVGEIGRNQLILSLNPSRIETWSFRFTSYR